MIQRALEPAAVFMLFVAVACLVWRASRGGDVDLSAGIVAVSAIGVLVHLLKTGKVRE